jgi:hypothetical protein
VIAGRTVLRWIAVCDNCGHEGIACPRRPGATNLERRHLAFIAAAGKGGEHLVPELDGTWLCNECQMPHPEAKP